MPKTPMISALGTAFFAMTLGASPAFAGETELMQKIDKLAAELNAMKAELAANRQKTDAVEQKHASAAATIPTASSSNNTVMSSYGEIAYSRPKNASKDAQADVGRAVLGIAHRFTPKTKMVAEFEWEHAVTSADDEGEAAVEQLYVEHEIKPNLSAKAGLFVIPVGLLNTSHEPTAYYGVHRNFVETAIIPTTWREVGFALTGNTDAGLTWDAGLTTGFNLSKWDAASGDGAESPLGSIHQEGQKAKSRDLSAHAALNWRGQPGLLLGASVFTGKAGQGTPDFLANDARITLGDVHARYTPGKWDLSALYARGTISKVSALNVSFAGNPTPVPTSFEGWYTQAAYQAWRNEEYNLRPFVRYEQFNTAKTTTLLPEGLNAAAGITQKVTTFGASFNIGEGVVLKADVQRFKADSNQDRFNLGVGYSF